MSEKRVLTVVTKNGTFNLDALVDQDEEGSLVRFFDGEDGKLVLGVPREDFLWCERRDKV